MHQLCHVKAIPSSTPSTAVSSFFSPDAPVPPKHISFAGLTISRQAEVKLHSVCHSHKLSFCTAVGQYSILVTNPN